MQRAPAQQMQMQMKDGLPCVRANVKDRAISFFETALFRELRRGQVQSADDLGILRLRLFQAGHVSLGNDQDVRRRLRVDVAEGEGVLIFIDFF